MSDELDRMELGDRVADALRVTWLDQPDRPVENATVYVRPEGGEMGDPQFDALVEDVHKAFIGSHQNYHICTDVAGFLIEAGWRHPYINASGERVEKDADPTVIVTATSGIPFTLDDLISVLSDARYYISPTLSTHEEISDIIGSCDCGYCRHVPSVRTADEEK